MTRQSFISTLAAALAIPSAGFVSLSDENSRFEDIQVTKYYVIKGGPYKDTGGIGEPGYMLGPNFIDMMKNWKHYEMLDRALEDIECKGFYLRPSSYFGELHREYNKIFLTKKWMLEFYTRHKNETFKIWKSKYNDYIADLKSRGWRCVNGRFCNPDLGY